MNKVKMIDERAAFEQWYSNDGEWHQSIERNTDGEYTYMPTAVNWNAWQARAALAATPAAPTLPDPRGCNACTHPDCGKFDGPRSVECRAMAEGVCARHDSTPAAAESVVLPEPVSTYIEVRECRGCGYIGINDADGTKAACNTCEWQGESPVEDKCPDCNEDGTMTSACPKCGARTSLIAETNLLAGVSAPAAHVGDEK